MHPIRILTLNSGSSSLKMAMYEMGSQESLMLTAEAHDIGAPQSRLSLEDVRTGRKMKLPKTIRRQEEALEAAFQLMRENGLDAGMDAISHRLVHGGRRFEEPQLITPQLLGELGELASIDPDHLPQEIENIETVRRKFPNVPQVGCFDTAFHRTMPRVAQLCPLPARYFDEGIQRYGFHGISYEYILSELRTAEANLSSGRIVIAHLGSGASMAAIKNGRCTDTTMGFTPTSGLLMSTRCGDIDAGVLAYLLGQRKMSSADVDSLLNKRSGLLGVSGISGDMQELLAKAETHAGAEDAVALFCYRAKKYLAAYAAILGGLDILVFTAGIGENAPVIRERICAGLEMLGIRIDPPRNSSNAPIISSDDSRVSVRVMKTNENLMLARHAAAVLKSAIQPKGDS